MVTNKIQVLVVDDSPFIRRSITKFINDSDDIEVLAAAKNGEEAIRLTLEKDPDVITLDVDMPKLDGLEALKKIMGQKPTPVLMVSSLTEEGAKETLEALSLGAMDFIDKNLEDSSLNITRIENELLEKIRNLHRSRHLITKKINKREILIPSISKSNLRVDSVIIGISTGGPKALMEILPTIPKDFPVGIVVVQHMPVNFIPPFVDRLNNSCPLEVVVTKDNDTFGPGKIFFAPGGMDLRLRETVNGELKFLVREDKTESLYKPSIDNLMLSASGAFGERCLAVIMTGMGNDGLKGVAEIKEKGGRCIVQDHSSSVVFGMPRVILENGYADKVVHLDDMISQIYHFL